MKPKSKKVRFMEHDQFDKTKKKFDKTDKKSEEVMVGRVVQVVQYCTHPVVGQMEFP